MGDAQAPRSSVPALTSAADVERIAREAFCAFGQGVGRVQVDPAAVHTFHEYFIPKIHAALAQPDWDEAWQREKAYVVAYAEALGQRAARLAVDDRRPYVAPKDVDEARIKLRGWMPIAARWCPL